MSKMVFLFIRHLGFAAMIFITAYAFLFRDIPFPFNANRFAVWIVIVLISVILIAVSLLGEKKTNQPRTDDAINNKGVG